jgi:fructose transport system substrate-binding protein
MNRALFKSSVFGAAAFALMALSSAASAQEVGACLITKTDTNPFFVKMKEGADRQGGKELGVTLKSYAGKVDGDS